MASVTMESLEQRTLFTVLTFQPATGLYSDYQALPPGYGDRVTAAVQNGFKYGTAGGTTPKIVADYGTSSTTLENWQSGYGNLPNVVFSAPNGSKFTMKLTADAGYNVSLSSFDMASFGSSYTINSITVTDGSGHSLFSKTKALIPNGTTHSHFSFSAPLTASSLIIGFDSSNSGGFNVGMDNVQFSQVALTKYVISGAVFGDTNINGKKDPTETGLANFRVFIDVNNDGRYDSTDPSVLTDLKGNYSFTLQTAGTYVIGVQLNRGYYQTSPHALVYTVKFPGPSVTTALFGVKAIQPV